MSEKQILVKMCKDCKYYVQHYIISGQYLTTTSGHCRHSKILSKVKYSEGRFNNKCPYWEATEKTPQKVKETVETVIRQMNDKLDILLQILTVKDE